MCPSVNPLSSPQPPHEKGDRLEDQKEPKPFQQRKEKTEEQKKKENEEKEGTGQAEGKPGKTFGELGSKVGAVQSTKDVSSVEQIKQVNGLIKTMLTDLAVGKNSAEMTLKADPKVPVALEGAKISLNIDGQKVSINFNLTGTQSPDLAKKLFESEANRIQLLNLATALQAKNLTLAELSVGGNPVATLQPDGKIQMVERVSTVFAEQGSTRERQPNEEKEDRGEKEK